MGTPEKLKFGKFELNRSEAELCKHDKPVKIEPQVFDLLWYFATNAGKLLSKDDIVENVWAGRIVSEAAISTRINGARVAIDDNGKDQILIRTIPRRGYRFLAEVSELADVSPVQALPDAASDLAKPKIAIMPIQSIDGTDHTKALAEGMRIDIQNALIKVSGLFLTAVGSVNAAKDLQHLDAAKALNARYLMVGQLRSSGDKMRLSIQLLDAENNIVVLSDQFDHEIEDTFKVLDEVAAQVLETINVALVAGEPARVWHKTLKDIDSLSILYRGISNFFKMNREALALAREDFERVARRHSDQALGYTWISLTHWFDLQRGWSEDKTISQTKARQFAEKATELPDTDGQAHTVLSHVYLLDRNFSAALEAGESAVANRPSCTNANAFYANVLHYCGENAKALNHIRLALHQSPFAPNFFKLILVKTLYALGQFEEAEELLQPILCSQTLDVPTLMLACLLADGQKRPELAMQYANQIRLANPSSTLAAFVEAEPYFDKNMQHKINTQLSAYGLASA